MMSTAQTLLGLITTYGPWALGVTVLLGALGVPIPTGVLVMASGALVRAGEMDGAMAAGLALAAAVLGDAGSYALGRLASSQAQRRLGHRLKAQWASAQKRFHRQGGLAILSTRSLLTSLDVPTSLIAGSSGYPLRQFISWDVVGRVSWLLLYGGLGYAFGSQWEVTSNIVREFAGWLAGAGLAGLALYLGYRLCRNWRRRVRPKPGLRTDGQTVKGAP